VGSKGPRKSSLTKRPYMAVQRETDLGRQPDTQVQRLTMLILTNGEKTEVDYFDALKMEPWVTVTRIRVEFRSGDPISTVEHAVRIQSESGYDKVWAVCDVDEYDVLPALQCARELGVGFALSEPCFEIWLILHKKACRRGFNNATQVDEYLRRLVPGWDKTSLDFSDFRDGVMDAVTRAKDMGEPPHAHPSTTVWRLVESLKAGNEEPDP